MKRAIPLTNATLRAFRAALRALVRKIGRQLKEETECCGVGFLVCLVLLELDDAPGRSLKELAASLGTDKAALSRVVDRLVKNGLARRDENPSDRRAIVINLTPPGRQQAAVINRYCDGKYRRLFQFIPPREHAAVIRAIGYLAEAFDQFGNESRSGDLAKGMKRPPARWRKPRVSPSSSC
jgi:DNA-binding MarR family transcriptional regulator